LPARQSPDGNPQSPDRQITRFTNYQTRHAFFDTIGASAGQENAFWNSGMFTTVPFTR
jgi:hypothetical protein